MKKLFLFCLVAFAAAFVSCSNDDGVTVSKSKLVGTWEIYKIVEQYGHESDVDDEFGEEAGYRTIIEVRADGTGTVTEMDYYSGSWHSYSDDFTYTLSGNKIRISGDGEHFEATVEKLTSSELVFSTKEREDGMTYMIRSYMKRIK